MSGELIEFRILMTEAEIDNLVEAVNGDDESDFHDSWKSETRKITAAKVLLAVTIAKQINKDFK